MVVYFIRYFYFKAVHLVAQSMRIFLEHEKPYLMKLRASEQKRQKRKLVYSKSDPTTRRSRPRLRHVSSASSTGNASDHEDKVTLRDPLSAEGTFTNVFQYI